MVCDTVSRIGTIKPLLALNLGSNAGCGEKTRRRFSGVRGQGQVRGANTRSTCGAALSESRLRRKRICADHGEQLGREQRVGHFICGVAGLWQRSVEGLLRSSVFRLCHGDAQNVGLPSKRFLGSRAVQVGDSLLGHGNKHVWM